MSEPTSILEKVPNLEKVLDTSTIGLIRAMEAHSMSDGTKENIFTTVIRDSKLLKDPDKNKYMLAISEWYSNTQ